MTLIKMGKKNEDIMILPIIKFDCMINKALKFALPIYSTLDQNGDYAKPFIACMAIA